MESICFEEYMYAKNRPMPCIAVVEKGLAFGLDAIVPDELADSQVINLKDADEPDEIAPNVAKQVLDRIKTLPPKS